MLSHLGAKPIATPARSMVATGGAGTVPIKKQPNPSTSSVVKTEPGHVVMPPPCTSFTPVKSPEPKRKKGVDNPAPSADDNVAKRNLCGEFDSKAVESEVPGDELSNANNMNNVT